jgi:hypothetical protein
LDYLHDEWLAVLSGRGLPVFLMMFWSIPERKKRKEKTERDRPF